MVQADYLFLMTDVGCLYDKNPRTNPDARAIEVVEDLTSLTADGKHSPLPLIQYNTNPSPVTTPGSSLGTGGMLTKVVAARLATSAGVTTIITRSSQPGNINKILTYLQDVQATNSDGLSSSAPLHTRFLPNPNPIRDRSFWLLHGLRPNGTIYIDEGAYLALLNKAGLLPVGIIGVEGNFAQQESVHLVIGVQENVKENIYSSSATIGSGVGKKGRGEGKEVGRALVNYSATEIMRIKGLKSTEIVNVLGYADSEYVAHRENISFFPAAVAMTAAGNEAASMTTTTTSTTTPINTPSTVASN